MSFELRDHTADVAVAATGETLGAVFAAVADGLTAAMCDSVPSVGERRSFTIDAEGPEPLLFDYLDELIYRRDVEGVLPAEHEATVESESNTVTASYRAVPLTTVAAREIKAVTYSEMRLERVADGWEAYVVFDV